MWLVTASMRVVGWMFIGMAVIVAVLPESRLPLSDSLLVGGIGFVLVVVGRWLEVGRIARRVDRMARYDDRITARRRYFIGDGDE